MPVLQSGWLFFVRQQAIALLQQPLIRKSVNALHSVRLANRSAYFGAHPSAKIVAQPVALLEVGAVFCLFFSGSPFC